MPEKFEKPFGVIDIGSNAVRMVVFDCSVSPPLHTFNEKVFCGLGRDLAITNRLSPEGIAKALKTLQGFVYLAEAQMLGSLAVVGTEAIRQAEDGEDFLALAKEKLNLDIRVLSGDEEARYAALGVMSLDSKATGVVADFGGGSLELARIEQGKIFETISLPLGSLRLVAQTGPLNTHIAEHLEKIPSAFLDPLSLYTIGGSWRSLAEAHMIHNGGTRSALQGYSMTLQDVISFCDVLRGQPMPDLMQVFHLEERRARLMPVSALMLQSLIQALRPEKVVVSTAGLRDGIVFEAMNG